MISVTIHVEVFAVAAVEVDLVISYRLAARAVHTEYELPIIHEVLRDVCRLRCVSRSGRDYLIKESLLHRRWLLHQKVLRVHDDIGIPVIER